MALTMYNHKKEKKIRNARRSERISINTVINVPRIRIITTFGKY